MRQQRIGRLMAGSVVVVSMLLALQLLSLPAFADRALSLSTQQAEPGSSLSISGIDFDENDLVALCWDRPRCANLGLTRTDDDGSFSTNVSVPGSATPGSHTITACEFFEDDCGRATLTVVADVATSTSSTMPQTTSQPISTTTTSPPTTTSASPTTSSTTTASPATTLDDPATTTTEPVPVATTSSDTTVGSPPTTGEEALLAQATTSTTVVSSPTAPPESADPGTLSNSDVSQNQVLRDHQRTAGDASRLDALIPDDVEVAASSAEEADASERAIAPIALWLGLISLVAIVLFVARDVRHVRWRLRR